MIALSKIRLGVNVDHVATVRNSRGGAHPDPVDAARIAMDAGADGITMHLREDRRHIRDTDIERLMATGIRLNFEMAATDEMVAIAIRLRPAAACLVPERRTEVTTEGGLDAAGQFATLAPRVARLREAGIRVSLFLDPDAAQLDAAQRMGAEVVELHTGAYAEGHPGALDRLAAGARHLASLGLECHAGHGLTFDNLPAVAQLAEVVEVNIGHFIIGQAIFDGLAPAIRHFRAILDAARPSTYPRRSDGSPVMNTPTQPAEPGTEAGVSPARNPSGIAPNGVPKGMTGAEPTGLPTSDRAKSETAGLD